MGWRKITTVQVGDLVSIDGIDGSVTDKVRHPEHARTADEIDGYTITVAWAQASRRYTLRLPDKLWVHTNGAPA